MRVNMRVQNPTRSRVRARRFDELGLQHSETRSGVGYRSRAVGLRKGLPGLRVSRR
jgi:hypothetical protein